MEIENNSTQDFLQNCKDEAYSLFTQKGLPTQKDEDWKYFSFTTIQQLIVEDAVKNLHIDISLVKEILSEKENEQKIVFINGFYSEKLSTVKDNMIAVIPFSKAALQEDFQQKINSLFQNNYNGFVQYNTAHIGEGIYLKVEENARIKDIKIYFFSHNANVVNPRIIVDLEKSSSFSCVEKHINLSNKVLLENMVSEYFVAENAQLDLVKIQNDTQNTILIDTTAITQKSDSIAKVHTISLGNKQIRNTLNFYQKGQNCHSVLKGISILQKNQEVDHHTLIHHFEPKCESYELYRGIYNDSSHGIFNGKVVVAKEAQKLNAYQQNNSILLSEEAKIETKPQLEIFADNVKCSHGCTIGQLDKDAIFYMQSRGIPRKVAQGLLTVAFMEEVVETIENGLLKQEIKALIYQKLQVDFTS